METPASGAATREIPPEVAELASEWGIAPPGEEASAQAEPATGPSASVGAPAATETVDAPSAAPAAGTPVSATQETAEVLAAEEWEKRVKLHEDAATRAAQEAAQLRAENEQLRRTYQDWYAANQQRQAPPAQRAPTQDDFIRLAAQDPQQALLLLAQQQASYNQFMQQQAAAQQQARAEQAVASINAEIATYQAQGYKLANATEAFHAHVYRGVPLLDAVKQSHFATYKLLGGRGAAPAAQGVTPAPKRAQPPGVGRVMGARGTPRGTAPQTAADKHDLRNKSFDEATDIWMQETGQA